MTVICKNSKCEHNGENNSLQKIKICNKVYSRNLHIGESGHCQDYKRRKELTKGG